MSQRLSRLMQRRGRRPGLQLGYALAVVGAVVGAIGVELHSLPVFLAGLFVYGNGQAANLLARYAATDLAEPGERARAMSRIVFASTFGAVLGPLLIGPAEALGRSVFGFEKYTGSVGLQCGVLRRRDGQHGGEAAPRPPDRIGGVVAGSPLGPRQPIRRTVEVIRASPAARLAVWAMVISQVTMVAVMAMTPVHLKLHGHEGVSQFVVSLHIAGMYAFSPLVGRYSDRRGRLPAIRVGAALLVAATVLAAMSGDVEQLLFPSLWLSGSAGTSASSAGRACSSTASRRRSASPSRESPTCR